MNNSSNQNSPELESRAESGGANEPGQTQAGIKTRFVDHLPDLITPEDYRDPPGKKKIRIRISLTGDGVEVLGDTMHAPLLEALLRDMGAAEIQKMPCG